MTQMLQAMAATQSNQANSQVGFRLFFMKDLMATFIECVCVSLFGMQTEDLNSGLSVWRSCQT